MEKKYIIISAFAFTVFALTISFVALAYTFKTKKISLPGSSDSLPVDHGSITEGEIVEVAGSVTKYNADCAFDATCSVEIDNQYVIEVAAGMVPQELAPKYGLNDVGGDDVGAKVKARAKVVSEGDMQKGRLTELSIDEKDTNETFYLLKLQEYFACSDYCPDKPSKYQKVIFETITNPEDCKKVGGTPDQIIGWGVREICIAE
jgi:hypothetical protein